MADLGFLPGVKRLLDRTPGRRPADAVLRHPGQRRRRAGQALPVTAGHALGRPGRRPRLDDDAPRLRGAAADKAEVVRQLASGTERSLLFMRTKHTAKKLAKQLTAAGVPAVELHGNLSQNARERNLSAFTDGSTRVLVATDIAARGIHVDDVALVVHVDPPTEHKAYLHRSGRTARAGAGGTVVTLATPDQAGEVRSLTKQAGIRPVTVQRAPGRQHRSPTSPARPRRTSRRRWRSPTQPAGGRGARRGGGWPWRSGGRNGAASSSAAPARGAGAGGGRGRGGSGAAGPARTRAELAARAGSAAPAARRSRGLTVPVVLLVRHGQASFGADDYDVLSDLGRRQAEVAGEELRRRGLHAPLLVSGGLRRQRRHRAAARPRRRPGGRPALGRVRPPRPGRPLRCPSQELDGTSARAAAGAGRRARAWQRRDAEGSFPAGSRARGDGGPAGRGRAGPRRGGGELRRDHRRGGEPRCSTAGPDCSCG